jgi:hypothetical protein
MSSTASSSRTDGAFPMRRRRCRGGVGGGGEAATRDQQAILSAQSFLSFRLGAPLAVRPITLGPGNGRVRLRSCR